MLDESDNEVCVTVAKSTSRTITKRVRNSDLEVNRLVKKKKKVGISDGNVALFNTDVMEELRKKLRCSICLDSITRMTSTNCGHVFCRDCIVPVVKDLNRCPLCNKKLSPKDIHDLFL